MLGIRSHSVIVHFLCAILLGKLDNGRSVDDHLLVHYVLWFFYFEYGYSGFIHNQNLEIFALNSEKELLLCPQHATLNASNGSASSGAGGLIALTLFRASRLAASRIWSGRRTSRQ